MDGENEEPMFRDPLAIYSKVYEHGGEGERFTWSQCMSSDFENHVRANNA